MTNIWFTSDHHFFHHKVILYCNRPFSSADEMNELMISRWNEYIRPYDIVYHLGDFIFHARYDSALKLFDSLNGQKILVKGNHDSKITLKLPWKEIFDYKELKIDNMVYCMFHFPIEYWNKKHYGSVHLHGHSHGTSRPELRRIDVGVDCHHFYPVSLDNIIELSNEE